MLGLTHLEPPPPMLLGDPETQWLSGCELCSPTFRFYPAFLERPSCTVAPPLDRTLCPLLPHFKSDDLDLVAESVCIYIYINCISALGKPEGHGGSSEA